MVWKSHWRKEICDADSKLQKITKQLFVVKNAVFWDVGPCRSYVNRRFGGSVHTKPTRRQIPEDGILHSHSRENLKSYTDICHVILKLQFIGKFICEK
jgi:hypothetical protein